MTAGTTPLTTEASADPDSGWPTVAVVIPTRDRPELLRQAVSAALEQEYPGDLHVVVVFDQAAPDAAIATSGENRSVLVTSNVRTPGLAGARNSGIEFSAAEIEPDLVAFCDDDDAWLPGKVRQQVEALRADPEAVAAYCGIAVNYGDVTVERPAPLATVGFRDFLRSRLIEVHPSTLLIRRSVLDAAGLVSEEIPGSFAEDYELLLRLTRVGPVVGVTQPLVTVLWHRKSYFTARWASWAEALGWLLDRYPEFQSEPKGYARIAGQIAFANASLGQRRTALRWAAKAARNNPREPRTVLALAVACGAVSSDRVMRALHTRGRGI